MTAPTTFPITSDMNGSSGCWLFPNGDGQWQYFPNNSHATGETLLEMGWTHYSTLPEDQRPEEPLTEYQSEVVKVDASLRATPATSLAEAVEKAAKEVNIRLEARGYVLKHPQYGNAPVMTQLEMSNIILDHLLSFTTRLEAAESNNDKLLLLACAWEKYADVSGNPSKAATARLCARQLREHLQQPPTQ